MDTSVQLWCNQLNKRTQKSGSQVQTQVICVHACVPLFSIHSFKTTVAGIYSTMGSMYSKETQEPGNPSDLHLGELEGLRKRR
jgi:hypothetical protein